MLRNGQNSEEKVSSITNSVKDVKSSSSILDICELLSRAFSSFSPFHSQALLDQIAPDLQTLISDHTVNSVVKNKAKMNEQEFKQRILNVAHLNLVAFKLLASPLNLNPTLKESLLSKLQTDQSESGKAIIQKRYLDLYNEQELIVLLRGLYPFSYTEGAVKTQQQRAQLISAILDQNQKQSVFLKAGPQDMLYLTSRVMELQGFRNLQNKVRLQLKEADSLRFDLQMFTQLTRILN